MLKQRENNVHSLKIIRINARMRRKHASFIDRALERITCTRLVQVSRPNFFPGPLPSARRNHQTFISARPISCIPYHLESRIIPPNMALPRVYSLGHAFVSRGSMRVCATAFSQSRIANLSRPFVSTASLRDTTAQDSSAASSSKSPPVSKDLTEDLRKKNGASIALFRVPGDVTPEALKELFTGAGFDVYVT